MAIEKVSKKQLKNYLIYYHHLCDNSKLESEADVLSFIQRSGCIQYDPLNPAGRNADMVLQARYKDYRNNDIFRYIYEGRQLFDVWNKNMSIAPVTDWPCFFRFRKRHLQWCREQEKAVTSIRDYLKKNEYACSSDFDLEDKVDWHYGPQRLAKATLECMCYAGLAVVHHKKNTRRYYCLAENFIPQELLTAPDPFETDLDYYVWYAERRIRSTGLLWNRPSDAFLGDRSFKAEWRKQAFQVLEQKNRILPIEDSETGRQLYIPVESHPLLHKLTDDDIQGDTAKLIAPLDNLIWDRNLIQFLFGFEYKWEVYVPEPLRKYGYYVLPILYKSDFIGRIEVKATAETLNIIGFWPEQCYRKTKHRQPLRKGLKHFALVNGCKNIAGNDMV